MDRLFDLTPPRWGLRGDVYVWRAMRERLAGVPVPTDRDERTRLLSDVFAALVGVDLTERWEEEAVYRREFAHGGMSSGVVHLPTWRDRLVPLLVARGAETGDVARDLAPTGVLRASINLGNAVLTNGDATAPGGVTVGLTHEIAVRLGLPVELVCFDAARKSYDAMVRGDADLCFLAIEPAREAEVAFTAPYVLIAGVYAVPEDSPVHHPDDVDRPGTRIGVKRGSAYDLFLTRTLRHAELVRGEEGMQAFLDGGLDAAAGIRQPLAAWVASQPGLRLVEERFMQIEQAIGTTKDRHPDTIGFLRDTVEDLKAAGWVGDWLRASGQLPSLAAPPAEPA